MCMSIKLAICGAMHAGYKVFQAPPIVYAHALYGLSLEARVDLAEKMAPKVKKSAVTGTIEL